MNEDADMDSQNDAHWYKSGTNGRGDYSSRSGRWNASPIGAGRTPGVHALGGSYGEGSASWGAKNGWEYDEYYNSSWWREVESAEPGGKGSGSSWKKKGHSNAGSSGTFQEGAAYWDSKEGYGGHAKGKGKGRIAAEHGGEGGTPLVVPVYADRSYHSNTTNTNSNSNNTNRWHNNYANSSYASDAHNDYDYDYQYYDYDYHYDDSDYYHTEGAHPKWVPKQAAASSSGSSQAKGWYKGSAYSEKQQQDYYWGKGGDKGKGKGKIKGHVEKGISKGKTINSETAAAMTAAAAASAAAASAAATAAASTTASTEKAPPAATKPAASSSAASAASAAEQAAEPGPEPVAKPEERAQKPHEAQSYSSYSYKDYEHEKAGDDDGDDDDNNHQPESVTIVIDDDGGKQASEAQAGSSKDHCTDDSKAAAKPTTASESPTPTLAPTPPEKSLEKSAEASGTSSAPSASKSGAAKDIEASAIAEAGVAATEAAAGDAAAETAVAEEEAATQPTPGSEGRSSLPAGTNKESTRDAAPSPEDTEAKASGEEADAFMSTFQSCILEALQQKLTSAPEPPDQQAQAERPAQSLQAALGVHAPPDAGPGMPLNLLRPKQPKQAAQEGSRAPPGNWSRAASESDLAQVTPPPGLLQAPTIAIEAVSELTPLPGLTSVPFASDLRIVSPRVPPPLQAPGSYSAASSSSARSPPIAPSAPPLPLKFALAPMTKQLDEAPPKLGPAKQDILEVARKIKRVLATSATEDGKGYDWHILEALAVPSKQLPVTKLAKAKAAKAGDPPGKAQKASKVEAPGKIKSSTWPIVECLRQVPKRSLSVADLKHKYNIAAAMVKGLLDSPEKLSACSSFLRVSGEKGEEVFTLLKDVTYDEVEQASRAKAVKADKARSAAPPPPAKAKQPQQPPPQHQHQHQQQHQHQHQQYPMPPQYPQRPPPFGPPMPMHPYPPDFYGYPPGGPAYMGEAYPYHDEGWGWSQPTWEAHQGPHKGSGKYHYKG